MGKTTLIKEWMIRIGVADNVSSPSYSIVNEYRYDGNPIYHVDCYRMESINEAYEIGMEEYLDSKHLCLIEWPQIILPMICSPFVCVTLSEEERGVRRYHIEIQEE